MVGKNAFVILNMVCCSLYLFLSLEGITEVLDHEEGDELLAEEDERFFRVLCLV